MVPRREVELYQYLDDLGIAYTRHEHPPVYTVEEAREHCSYLEGGHCKNLLLRNRPGERHYLVVTEESKKTNLKSLARELGETKLSLASPRRLQKYLDLEPGAVSPFGLINDHNREVEVLLDQDLLKETYINFHPNVNTATVTLTVDDFWRFLKECGNQIYQVEL